MQKGFQQIVQTKGAPRVKQVTMTIARGSLTAPLVCALFERETFVWARNNNIILCLGLFLSLFPGIGNFCLVLRPCLENVFFV